MKTSGILRLIRPANCVMMGFAIIVGAAIGAGVGIINSWLSLILGFITGFTLTGSAMAVNDYYDREIDAINEPSRPIPSGVITPRAALASSTALAVIGLSAALLTNIDCLAVAVLALTIMVLYSTKGKRTGLPGNLLVSTSVALPFIYGGLAVNGTVPLYSLLFFLMALLSNTGREVTKGIVDVEGDRRNDVRTLAVSSGPRMASLTASAFYLSSVVISLLPPSMKLVSIWYTLPVALTDLGLVLSSCSLIRDPSRGNSRREKNRVLIWMLSGLIGFLVGNFP